MLEQLFLSLREACQLHFPEEHIGDDAENRLQCAFDSPPQTPVEYGREIAFMAGELSRWFPTSVSEDEALRLHSLIDDARTLPYLRSSRIALEV